MRGKGGANVSNGNVSKVSDFGISRKELMEARKLRDAERENPGIAERAIQQRLKEGFTPKRADLRANVGTKTATKEERGLNFYETHIVAIQALLKLVNFNKRVIDPGCGLGALVNPLLSHGHDV